MMNGWEIWLSQNPQFAFVGKDSDGDDSYDDSYDSEDSSDDESFDSDVDDDSDDSDDAPDTSARLRKLEADNKKLSRELEAAMDLLNNAADRENDSDEDPEGFVPQEDYDALVDLLRTDYVENAISGFRRKDGSPKWDWQDPSAVYKFLDIDELEIDVKSKTIDGLEAQLADIADRYPFMLKDSNRRGSGSGSTGKPPRGSGSREKKGNPSLEALIAEFPALID